MQTATVVNPKYTKNIGTSVVQIGGYTPAAGVAALIASCTVANTSGATIAVKVSVYDGTNDAYVAFNTPISAGDTLVVSALSNMSLVNGYYIRVVSSSPASCDAVMCVTEFQ